MTQPPNPESPAENALEVVGVVERDPAAPGDDATAPAAETPPSATASASVPWLPWTIAAVLAGLLAWVWLGLYAPLARDADRAEAVTAATINYVTQMTSWDARDGMADTLDALNELSTAGWQAEIANDFLIMEDLEARETQATAVIEDVFVQRIGNEPADELPGGELEETSSTQVLTAVVFGQVRQTISTNVPGPPSVSLRSFSATLVHVDGTWLMQNIQLIEDVPLSGGTPGVPNIGPDPEPSGAESNAPDDPIDNTVSPTEGETS